MFPPLASWVEAVSDGKAGVICLCTKTGPHDYQYNVKEQIGLRGADLLRVKGLLNVAGCRGPVVVQYVQHLAHPPVELESWPDQNRNSRLVFITRGISERQVRDLLASVRALAGP